MYQLQQLLPVFPGFACCVRVFSRLAFTTIRLSKKAGIGAASFHHGVYFSAAPPQNFLATPDLGQSFFFGKKHTVGLATHENLMIEPRRV
jgi:hypothetical protein